MSFLIQRATGRNLTLQSINTPVLRIGRGTNQELRSENPAVALEHAIIEADSAGYYITDKGSITGTYVNRKPVETARLGKGDVIEIGDLRIDVQLADPAKPLFLRITIDRPPVVVEEEGEEEQPAAVAAAAPGRKVITSRKFDYAGAYRLHRPWLTKLTVTANLLIVTLAVIGEVTRPERQKFFMPGGLSSAHARHVENGQPISEQCSACHLPWRSVSMKKCVGCHDFPRPHAVHAKSEPDCIGCHAEHRGMTDLASIPSSTCVACHRNLEPLMDLPGAQLASLKFANDRYSFENITRIAAFGASQHPDFSYPPDTNTLRFNHSFHLVPKGVLKKGRRTVLKCTDCHDLTSGDPKPVTYARHCHDCHDLAFLPNEEVPHGGDSGVVYGYIAGRSAGVREIIGKSPVEVRRILATRGNVNVDLQANRLGKAIFETRCRQCHEIAQRDVRLVATPPVMRARWLTHARFTHAKHRDVDCEKCHEGVRQSALTSDVLLPKLANCTGCHARNEQTGKTESACRDCHRYHLEPYRKRPDVAHAGMGGL